MKKILFYISFIGMLTLCITLILIPYYIAYLIVEPNSFFGLIGVFFLGSIIVPLSLGVMKFTLILVGINFSSLINRVKRRDFSNNSQIINIDYNKKKINKTNLILIILLLIGIIVSCVFFINKRNSLIEFTSSNSNTNLKINENFEDAEDLYQLALSYAYGRDGSPSDYVKSAELMKKSAELGYAEAQYNLGIIYETGEGVQQDIVKANEWTRKAAEQGNSKAQFSIAMMYLYGKGVPQDNIEAIKWLVKASNQGNTYAQQKLKELQDSQ